MGIVQVTISMTIMNFICDNYIYGYNNLVSGNHCGERRRFTTELLN